MSELFLIYNLFDKSEIYCIFYFFSCMGIIKVKTITDKKSQYQNTHMLHKKTFKVYKVTKRIFAIFLLSKVKTLSMFVSFRHQYLRHALW